jgi:hypothetical protein
MTTPTPAERRAVAESPDPRFFPGERVVHSSLGRGTVVWIPSDAQTYLARIEVVFGDGMLHMVRREDLASETAARFIPYGDTR